MRNAGRKPIEEYRIAMLRLVLVWQFEALRPHDLWVRRNALVFDLQMTVAEPSLPVDWNRRLPSATIEERVDAPLLDWRQELEINLWFKNLAWLWRETTNPAAIISVPFHGKDWSFENWRGVQAKFEARFHQHLFVDHAWRWFREIRQALPGARLTLPRSPFA